MKAHAKSTTPHELRNLWRTPDWAFTPLDAQFNFAVDIAADADNAKVPMFITKETDALTVNWGDYIPHHAAKTAWCNPPYDDITPWMEAAYKHALHQGIITVLFVPNTPDASWWPDNASEIRLITGTKRMKRKKRKADPDEWVGVSGRVQYVRADTGKPVGGNNKGSCYVIFAPGTLGNMTTKYIKITELQAQHKQLKEAQKNAA